MENTIMKLKELKINKLHGHVDYEVNFNDNITFLFGDNGCGKTTILNIVTYIITGKIYELSRYKFKTITLKYISSKTKKYEEIIVSSIDNYNLEIEYKKEKTIIDLQRFEYINRSSEDNEDVERFYFSEYPILENIKDVFNYIYLPLNRNSNIHNDNTYPLRYRRMMRARGSSKERNGFDFEFSLLDVEALVTKAYNKVTFESNCISENFSDDILSSLLDVDNIFDLELILKYMYSLKDSEIRNIQADYTNVIKTILNWDDNTETKINNFFDSLITDSKKIKYAFEADKNNDESTDNAIELLFKFSELIKMKKIISDAEKTEQLKKQARQPIDDFLNTVNNFIRNEEMGKEIKIYNDGSMWLLNHGKEINIHNISSGEKQIITFFAYLIFGLETTNQSIFIVDEPELSLHLNWQRKFVDAIMDINKNVQLIFATHAPEIIGKHYKYAVKLIPQNKTVEEN